MQVHIKQENQVKASQWEHYAFVVLFILSREKRERERTYRQSETSDERYFNGWWLCDYNSKLRF